MSAPPVPDPVLPWRRPDVHERAWPWALDLLLALAAGALHSLVYVHTEAWWAQIGCVAWLCARVQAASPWRAALLGWAHGVAWLGAGVWWLFISLHRYGGLAAPLAVLAVLALCSALALYLALAMAWHARARAAAGPGRWWADVARFGALWVAADLARGLIFTGFPWLATGYAQVDAPLAALAPWIGVYGIGGVVAALAALLVHPALRRPWRLGALTLGVAAALGALGASGGGSFTRPAGTLPVTLIQTNVAQDEKFAAAHLPAALDALGRALADARGTLVLAPETAVPLLPAQLEQFMPTYWPALQARFSASGRAALLGVPLGDPEHGYTNSVVALSSGAPYRYDKVHLVPFGEFIPTGFRWFTELMDIPLGDFSRGPTDAPSFELAGQRIAPTICYEDLFGEELGLRFADAARAPTVLVNVSNIGWFGPTIAVPQHLNISRMRSLEFQRPMLRATNTGATALIDHRGRIVAQLAPFTRGVLDGRAEGRDGLTPYARWTAALGLWPLIGLVALTLAAGAIGTRRAR